MSAIFLSASVPVVGRGTYHETADPFLIQCAVRELIIAVIRDRQIVWGGHPAITPMVRAICQDMNVDYQDSVILYQSRFFEDYFPADNEHFDNVILVDKAPGDRAASLLKMREAMLSRSDLEAAVFIGGMDGVGDEYEIFVRFHPHAKVLPVPSTGGAARQLAERMGSLSECAMRDMDYARLFRSEFPIAAGDS